jgi:magnesium-transporting ATPase (P-type)
MFMCFFGTVIIKDSPLNAVQLLWVNLIMDTLGALALATEEPAHDILQRQPYKKDNAIVTEVMWRNVFGHAIWQITLLTVILLGGQGVFYMDYNLKCLKFDDKKVCTSYNPYYTTDLYLLQPSVDSWKTMNLKVEQFDSTLLAHFSCNQDNMLSPFDVDCQTGVQKFDKVLPQTLKKFSPTQKLRHYTVVFNIFVFLQIFNIINARKIEQGELNVFKNFFNNWLFLFVLIITISL